MYKKIALMVSLGLPSLTQAESWQWQIGIGKGLNKALIQQHGIANAEAASVGVHIPVDWVSAFAWGGVDRTYIKLQYSYLSADFPSPPQHLSIAESALVFRWIPRSDPDWFSEIGVGVSHLSSRTFGDIQMHGQNNFSLDFAVGKQLAFASNWEVSVRYRHYSNGYTHRPNPGLDYGAIVIGYRF
jgi:opacity protein-like surface antigen